MDSEIVKEALSPEEKNVRKLRKKLRQIEKLEFSSRDLNEEEVIKVNNKGDLRKELQSLLRDIQSNEADMMKRQGQKADAEVISKKAKTDSASTVQPDVATEPLPTATKKVDLGRDNREEDSEIPFVLSKKQKDNSKQGVSNSNPIQHVPETSVRPATASDGNSAGKAKQATSIWKDSSYQVFTLEGHNDIILSVDCTDECIISASRDTTVKVWRVGEVEEERSLRGHTSAVTAVVFLPETVTANVLRKFENDDEASGPSTHGSIRSECRLLALSGSLDCMIRVWDVCSGESFGSIYTYNGITALKCGDWGAVSGTEGGKLEVWCVVKGQCLASVNAFEDQVASLQVEGEHIYAGSKAGELGIWHYNPSAKTLGAVFVMEFESQAYVPLRCLASLVSTKGMLFIGDHGPNIKVLDWKTGHINRLANHIGDTGITDCLELSSDEHLLSSSYLVDTGCSSINVRKMTSGGYVCTLADKDEGRYLSMSTAPGVIVTGGHLLKVWLQGERGKFPKKKSPGVEIIHPTVLRKLSRKAVESASEDDSDFISSSDDEDSANDSDKSDKDSSEKGTGWWCNIL